MQTMAVLLLEMAYEGKHLKEKKENVIQCIKKMIAWLRAMQVKDPVAARAYEVVFKILKTCAPALQEQIQTLFDKDLSSEFPPQDSVAPQDPMGGSSPGYWDHAGYGGYPAASQEGFPSHTQESMMDPLYPHPSAEQHPMTYAFGNPFFTSFDQGAPLVDMQNLWWQSASPADRSLDPSGIGLSQRPSGVELSQQQLMQEQMQQQMHQSMLQAELAKQVEREGKRKHPPY
jgi:hypothetical protein